MKPGIELDLTEKSGNVLWKLYRNGVVAAYEELFDRHYDRIIAFLQAKFGLSLQDAEEIAQDTFLKAHRNRHSFQPDKAKFSTWLYTIAKRTAITRHHSARNRYIEPLEQEDADGENYTVENEQSLFRAPDRVTENGELGELLDEAIESMTPMYQQATRRVLVNREKYRDVAADLGLPMGTLKSRVYRARQQLQARLREYA